MNTGEILIRFLKFGLILYLALTADQVLYREGTTRGQHATGHGCGFLSTF